MLNHLVYCKKQNSTEITHADAGFGVPVFNRDLFIGAHGVQHWVRLQYTSFFLSSSLLFPNTVSQAKTELPLWPSAHKASLHTASGAMLVVPQKHTELHPLQWSEQAENTLLKSKGQPPTI